MLVRQKGKGVSMKYCFIINPNAGKGAFTAEVVENIKRTCHTRNADYDVFISEDFKATKDYVNSMAQEGERVSFIACGGDGTLCKTVVAVMALPEDKRELLSVGVVPMGTGNDFVSNFENKELFFDIDAQLEATPYEIDLLKCNDMYSVNMINIGFDSHVVCKKEQIGQKAWVPRKLAYIISLLFTLVRKPGVKMSFSADGREAVKKELLLTTLANGEFCGGGFHSNPKASLVDGAIDCIAVKNIGRMKFLSLVGDYKKGLHLGEKFKDIVEHFNCSEADMYLEEETPVSIDGEIVHTKELHISVQSKALKFMLPRGVAAREREIIDNGILISHGAV